MEIIELLDVLGSSTVDIKLDISRNRKFNGVALPMIVTARALSDFDVIFFSSASLFNGLPAEARSQRAFFLFLDEPIGALSSETFVATIRDRQAWLGAFETVSNEFLELQRKKELIISLTDLVNRGASLETVLNIASTAVGAPASILDNSLSFVAVSDGFPAAITHGEDARGNTLPLDAFPLLKAKGLANVKKPFDLRVFDWTDSEGNVRTNHYALIHAGSTIIGSVSFFTMEKRLRPSRAAMLPTIAQILSILMQRSDVYTLNKRLYYAHLFKQLETGNNIQDINRLRSQFSSFGYNLKPRMHMLVADLSRQFLSIEDVQPLADRLLAHIDNAVYTVNHTEIIFLSSTDAPSKSFYDRSALETELGDGQIMLGASSGFTEVRDVRLRIEEARRAIAAARRLGRTSHVLAYPDYRLDDLILHIDDDTVVDGARFSPLLRLLDEGEHEGTELARTLWLYLANPSHPVDVAAELFIHKNTLYYRLDKNRQIMGCDFKDAETIANIQITFHILRLQGRFDPTRAPLE